VSRPFSHHRFPNSRSKSERAPSGELAGFDPVRSRVTAGAKNVQAFAFDFAGTGAGIS
jgi:hypothetical protein